mmetsp:Transcript_26563/g.66026  ORF Transcript_26563/g.66026 Transcript_26563/m.66026 type:complete len:207 (-) Transcript_26563:18-638(-)
MLSKAFLTSSLKSMMLPRGDRIFSKIIDPLRDDMQLFGRWTAQNRICVKPSKSIFPSSFQSTSFSSSAQRSSSMMLFSVAKRCFRSEASMMSLLPDSVRKAPLSLSSDNRASRFMLATRNSVHDRLPELDWSHSARTDSTLRRAWRGSPYISRKASYSSSCVRTPSPFLSSERKSFVSLWVSSSFGPTSWEVMSVNAALSSLLPPL